MKARKTLKIILKKELCSGKKILINFILSAFFLAAMHSQDNVKINIKSNKYDVSINEVFQINIEIMGISENATIENIENLDSSIIIKQTGTMSNMNFANGEVTSSLVYNFLAKISKAGTYEIGPFDINISNKQLKSDKIKINVSESNEKNITNINSTENSTEKNNQIYLLDIKADKNEIYVNEELNVEINFLTQVDFFKIRDYQPLKFPATSWVERINIDNDNQNEKIRKNNKVYLVQKCEKVKVFITKSGKYTINPACLEILGMISPSYYPVPEVICLKTEPLVLNVKPLPDNPPKGFNQAVGCFKINYDITPLKLKAKELVTLQAQLQGTGNFQNINDISYDVDDSIEVYSKNNSFDDKASEKVKSWEILLVPSKEGRYKLRINDFNYFDVNLNKYVTLKGKEYYINVLKNEDNNSEINNQSTNEDKFKTEFVSANSVLNIHHIKLSIGNKKSIFFEKFWFNYILLFYILLLVVFLFFILFKYLSFKEILLNNINSSNNIYKQFIKRINILKKDFNKNKFNSDETDKILIS